MLVLQFFFYCFETLFLCSIGQQVALVGTSGCGKSTTIQLVERFYDPTNGRILIDGRNIEEYDHKYLHQKIAMVGQEPVLFNRSIKENIAYAINENDDNNNKDDTAIVRAAEEANAHGFITDLGSGYDTVCGQRGGHLSG